MKTFKAISIVGLVLLAALVCSTQAAVPAPNGEDVVSAFLKKLTKKYLQYARSDDWTVAAHEVDVLDYTREQIFADNTVINEADFQAFQISVTQTGKLQKIAAQLESHLAELKSDIEAIQNMVYK